MSVNRFRLSIVAILIIILGLQVILPIANVSANDGNGVSWSGGAPEVYSSNVVKDTSATGIASCAGTYITSYVDGEVGVKNVCLFRNGNFKAGSYYDPSLMGYKFVVGYGLTNKMYRLQIDCYYKNSCLYSLDQDALLMKIRDTNGISSRLIMYKNFSKSIIKGVNFINHSTIYLLNKSNPDFEFKLKNGNNFPVGALSISSDGKWLSFEIINGGIGIFNIKDLNIKRISSSPYSYGYGYDPFIDMAIDNDGRHISVIGSNAGFSIFEIAENCGDNIVVMGEAVNITTNNQCKKIIVDLGFIANEFIEATNPTFNENGTELRFFVFTNKGIVRDVILRAKGYFKDRLNYLALGDSYSSGEGEPADENYVIGTNNENEKCHQSIRSYPFVVSLTLNMNPNLTRSVACSGATTSDIVGDDAGYWGQGGRLLNVVADRSEVEKTNLQSVANETFLPGRIHQETFVKDYKPKTITVGVGGNDVGFADKLMACLAPGTCDWAATSEGREKTAIEMKGLFERLVTTYQNLQNDSPDAKIYAIGYPRFIEPMGECATFDDLLGIKSGHPLINTMLDLPERIFIDQGVMYLNQVIEAAAKKVGIKYISIEDSFGNHKICGSDWQKAANFVAKGDDIGLPGDWLKWTKLVGSESFHPNDLGHRLASEAIVNSVGDLASYDYCNGATSCPQNISAPEPSIYWIPDGIHDYPLQKLVDFVYDKSDDVKDLMSKNLKLISYSLEPGSLINVEINSTPRSLGQFTVAADGSLDESVELPSDLEEGFHTVHIYGKSYSGEDVDLYQVISYFKPEPPTINKPITQNPVIEDDINNEVIANIVNTAITKTSGTVNLDGDGLIKDSFGDWSSRAIIDYDAVSDSNPDQFILSTSTTKKLAAISEKSLNEQFDDALYYVIIVTFCALFAAILTATIVRLNKA